MSFCRPDTLDELVAVRARELEWRIVAGGTDLMVEANFGRSRPAGLIDVSGVREMSQVTTGEDGVRLGAAVTFAQLEAASDSRLAGLAIAARTVASPQIRSMATLGGNVGTASPAGDAHPILVAAGATVELVSVDGVRQVPCRDYFLGPGRSVLRNDEVIAAIHLPLSASTSQQFSKIGTRNAMVISVASVGVVLDWRRRVVGVGLGSVGPTPLGAEAAQEYLASVLWPEDEYQEVIPSAQQMAEFAELVASAATPIDDVRGTASYRRHVVQVMARRTLSWALDDRRRQAS